LVDGSNVWTPSHVSSFGGVVSFILHLVIPALLFVVLSSPFGVEGFYLPGSYMCPKERLEVKVNSITLVYTELPYSYYSLPFCKLEGSIKKVAENIRELVMGDQIENSPYHFSMKMEELGVNCSMSALTENDVKHLK
jgi:transmembrane 9 superfamily protein 2/4